jgi:hypothetical protein
MTESTTRDSGLAASRRALLGAAWTAPVVVAASTAPAYAASAAASLVLDTFAVYPDDYNGASPNRIKAQVQVRREWSATAPVVTSLTVTLSFPGTSAAGGAPMSVTGSGWAAGKVTGSGDTVWTYTFTWTGALTNDAQSTPELAFTVKRRNVPTTSASLTVRATSPQATSASRTITATV